MLVAPTRHIVAALIPRLDREICIRFATRRKFWSIRNVLEFPRYPVDRRI
jgi:hypothetical protein